VREDGEMPRLLDLFCGRWGWSRAFAKRGWECVGVDLVEPAEIPEGCVFIKADVTRLRFDPVVGFYIIDGPILGFFDAIVASSPCEQFSVHGMKHFHPNPPYPELGIKLFNHTRQLCEASGVPYVMENVRAAQKFVGYAVLHFGPFYLWGNAVPFMGPEGIVKGFGDMSTAHYHANLDKISPHRRARNTATIPPELANCVADYAERLLEQKLSGLQSVIEGASSQPG
jgi:hypothetical protein